MATELELELEREAWRMRMMSRLAVFKFWWHLVVAVVYLVLAGSLIFGWEPAANVVGLLVALVLIDCARLQSDLAVAAVKTDDDGHPGVGFDDGGGS